MNDSGFGPAEDVIDAPEPVGGEGESPAPRAAFDRSPIKVLRGLSDNPLEQAVKAIEYCRSLDKRKATYLKACSPRALDLIAQNGPEYATIVGTVAA
jgi:hypothetical protein